MPAEKDSSTRSPLRVGKLSCCVSAATPRARASNFGCYLGLLLPAGIAWGIARWVRRGRQIREEGRRQLVVLENYAPPLPRKPQRQR